ncbi:DsbA family protein [Profundibacter sp.]
MTSIDYYFSTVSPYTYLAGTRLEQIAQTRGASITYKPLDIVALLARTGGIPPKSATRTARIAACRNCAGVLAANMAPGSRAISAVQNAGGASRAGPAG